MVVPRPQQERLLDMTQEEHTIFGLIVVREYNFGYTRRLSSLLYNNHKPTILEEESNS